MVKRIAEVLKDDLDGSEVTGIETIRFGWLGADYDIDLTEKHRAEFALAIGRYVQAARPAGTSSRPKSRTNAQRDLTRDIRAWANGQGHGLSERGRIPQAVTDAYWAAHTPTEREGTE